MDGPTEKVNETFQKSDRIYDKNGQKKIAQKLAVKKALVFEITLPHKGKNSNVRRNSQLEAFSIYNKKVDEMGYHWSLNLITIISLMTRRSFQLITERDSILIVSTFQSQTPDICVGSTLSREAWH